MSTTLHPDEALFEGEAPFPVLPVCDHYAGTEPRMRKALELQAELGPVFELTCDCEDGAPAGGEQAHAEMVVGLLSGELNRQRMAGVRIHDPAHPHWRRDVDILIEGLGEIVSHLTLPKPTAAAQVGEMIDYVQRAASRHGVTRDLRIHVLIETHGALHEAWEIAAFDWVKVLDFGLMDFVSGHHGAIPASAMRSPGQFEHRLVARAKTEIVAAALANGCVPAHSVTLDLQDPEATRRDALRARKEFGFLRMWSIHPIQIRPIVEAMRPDLSEVAQAAEILLAAQTADWGPIRHGGELHDRASYRYFWELLRKARVTGTELPAGAEIFFESRG